MKTELLFFASLATIALLANIFAEGAVHFRQEAVKTLVMDEPIVPNEVVYGPKGNSIVRAKRSSIRVVGQKGGHTQYSIESGEELAVGQGTVREIW